MTLLPEGKDQNEPIIKHWLCIGCGATITKPQKGVLVNANGSLVGCPFCGDTRKRPDPRYLPQIKEGSDGQNRQA